MLIRNTWNVDQKYSENCVNVVLEKAGDDQSNRSCEKLRSVKYSPGGEKYPKYRKLNEVALTGLVASCVGTAF